MISSLAAIGVPAAKIRIVFNRVEREVEAEFRIITGYYRQNRSFWLNTDCAIFETELFDALAIKRLPTQSLLEDQADYRALLKDKEAPAADRNNWSDMFGLKLLAKGVNKSLDHVFEELIKGKTL